MPVNEPAVRLLQATPTPLDDPEIDSIVTRVREKGYGFRSLVHEIVQSGLFQSK